MYLNNTYLMLLNFINYALKKIFKPKTLSDNIIGSLLSVALIYIVIVFYIKFI